MGVEQAWAAGFFDGEGNVHCCVTTKSSGRRHGQVQLRVAQSEPETLRRFMATVGGLGKVSGPFTRPAAQQKTRTHKPMWVYYVGKYDRVQQVMAMLWPYLSGPKKTQFAEAFLLERHVRASR